MFGVEWLMCCINLARSLAILSPAISNQVYTRDLAESLYLPSLQFSGILSRALEESSSTWPDQQELGESPLAALTAFTVPSSAANPMVPLNTPLGELMVPFSSLFSKGLRMLFDMFKDQQLPISQADLTVLTTGLNELAAPAAASKTDDRESPPSAHAESRAPAILGITFSTPKELTKTLTSVEMPIVLIGVDDDASRLIRSNEFEAQVLEATDKNQFAEAIAKLGLASVWAEMDDRDFMDSLAIVDTSGLHDNLKYTKLSQESNLSAEEVKESLIKDLLVTTTDTLPWLPLDGIVKTLPKFLVDRMGKTGEILGTLASYWKSGAETIDNVASGILKPVLNNVHSKDGEEDYTGRNGFVENVNVPDEDVSIQRKIVTGAGIPPRQQASQDLSAYMQYQQNDSPDVAAAARSYYSDNYNSNEGVYINDGDYVNAPRNFITARRALWDESITRSRPRRSLWESDSRQGVESSSELFDNVQRDSDSSIWHWSDLDEDWIAPPFVEEGLSRAHKSVEEDQFGAGSTSGFSRSSFDLDPFGIDYYKHSLSEPEWDFPNEKYSPSPSSKGKHKSSENNDRNKLNLSEKLHLLDRLHEQHAAKKSAHRNRLEDSRTSSLDDSAAGPVSILREFVKNRQDSIRAMKEGPSAIERFRAERLGREKLIVGDDFDDEDELFDDEDDDQSIASPKHERLTRRRESAKTAPARDLAELPPSADWSALDWPAAADYHEVLPYADRYFLDSNTGGNGASGSNLIGNVISSFIGGGSGGGSGETDLINPAVNLMNAAAAAANPLSGIQNNNAALYDNLKASVQRQKEQLDDYLEQMAGMYNQRGPQAEAAAAAAAEKSAWEEERYKLMEEVARKVSEDLSNSMKEAEAQRAQDNNKLWDELEKERQVLEQLLGDEGTLSPLKKEVGEPRPAALREQPSPNPSQTANRIPIIQPPPSDPWRGSSSEDHDFYPVSNTSGNKLATIQDVINQMIGSISRLAPTRRRLYAERLIERVERRPPPSLERRPPPPPLSHDESSYEASEVIPEKVQIDPSEDLKNLNDWYDITEDWAGMRNDLVSQIASSVNDVSKTVHNNPLSDIVQSLIEGIVDANPLSDDRKSGGSSNYASRRDNEDDGLLMEQQQQGQQWSQYSGSGGGGGGGVSTSSSASGGGSTSGGGGGGVQDRLAQSAADMLRQISNKVIKSGPRIKSNALDLELKQPDPDPVKKSSASSWWF